MFGDDAERDPLIYSMFADICAGRLRGEQLIAAQRELGTLPEYASDVAVLAESVPARELVRGIHINLVREIDGSRILECDPRVVGYPSAGAAARYLFARGLIGERGRDHVDGAGEVVFGRGPVDPDGWWTPVARRR